MLCTLGFHLEPFPTSELQSLTNLCNPTSHPKLLQETQGLPGKGLQGREKMEMDQ